MLYQGLKPNYEAQKYLFALIAGLVAGNIVFNFQLYTLMEFYKGATNLFYY